jgi:hypothetical protein
MKISTISARVMSLLFIDSGSAFLLFQNRTLAYERMDPVVSPGTVSSHIHAAIGSSQFQQTFSADAWASSNCSSMEIQENLSSYWMPAMMVEHANGTFSALDVQEIRVYYRNSVGYFLPLQREAL